MTLEEFKKVSDAIIDSKQIEGDDLESIFCEILKLVDIFAECTPCGFRCPKCLNVEKMKAPHCVHCGQSLIYARNYKKEEVMNLKAKMKSFYKLKPVSEFDKKEYTKEDTLISVDELRKFIDRRITSERKDGNVWQAFACLKELSFREMNIYD